MRTPLSTALRAVLLTLGLLGCVGQGALAQEAVILIENIRVGLPNSPERPLFKVGTWTPVQVDLQAGPNPFRGTVEFVVPDVDNVPTVVRQTVDIPARALGTATAYVRPGSGNAEVEVRVYQEGRSRAIVSRTQDAESLEPSQTIVATLGNPAGVELLPNLQDFKVDAGLQTSTVSVIRLAPPGGLPGKWIGYDAVDTVVIDTNDRTALEALRLRNQALVDWVREGGHLVVAVGDLWQLVASPDNFLRSLLPAVPTGQTRLSDLGALESFAGSSRPITQPGDPPVLAATLVPVDERGGQPLDLSSGSPLVVRGHYGFGRVTVVGLNVDQKPFATWDDRVRFWLRVVDPPRPAGSMAAGTVGRGSFITNEVNDLSTYLYRSLEQFEGVRIIPFGWVAFFVFVYLLLIGPGDYFFLKKVVGRMEMTWLTFPLIVLTVSLLAYLAAYAFKGRDLRLNRVEVVDVDQAFGNGDRVLTRGTTVATVFSPANRDYDMAVLPLPLNDTVDAAKAATFPASKPAGTETIMTWFGIAETIFGGMGSSGNSSQLGFGTAGYSYGPLNGQPVGDPEEVRGVRVPIWTTKTMYGTWSTASEPALDVELTEVGPDRLEGTITNRLSRPLNDAIVAYGRQVYVFDRPIAPGETVAIERVGDQNLSSYVERLNQGLPSIGRYSDVGDMSLSRPKILRALLFARTGQARGSKSNVVLEHLDLSTQLALKRPILVADIDGPATALKLGEGSVRVDQARETTVLRVLLAPPKAGESTR